jgi:hypothetical protein
MKQAVGYFPYYKKQKPFKELTLLNALDAMVSLIEEPCYELRIRKTALAAKLLETFTATTVF